MPSHPVALSEFGSSLSPLVLAHRALDDPLILVVVALELARGMYFQVPIRLCACVAEGVVDPPRLEDERAGRGDHDLAADVEGQLALQHEGALVLSRVGVRRDHRARREAYLDDRKGAAEALRCHLVGYVQDGEVGTFSWTDEDFVVLCRHKALAPFRSASLMGDPTLPMQAGCQLALFGASNFAEFTFRDCMKSPDRCRPVPHQAQKTAPQDSIFGVSCYRRPTIGASPTTFHTVSPRTP